MAIVTVRRKPTYAELEAKIQEFQDALVIADKNKALREMGFNMLHKQVEELQQANRSLRMKLDQELQEGAKKAKTIIEIIELLVNATAERDEARNEAGDLSLEVQERNFRIDELEKQNKWLRERNEELVKIAAN